LRKLFFASYAAAMLAALVYLFIGLLNDTGPVGWLNSLTLQWLGSGSPEVSFLVLFGCVLGLGWLGLKVVSVISPDPQPAVRVVPTRQRVRQRWVWTGAVLLGVTWLVGAPTGWLLRYLHEQSQPVVPVEMTLAALNDQTPPWVLLQAQPVARHEVAFSSKKERQEITHKYVPLTEAGWQGEPVRVVWLWDTVTDGVQMMGRGARAKPRSAHPVHLARGDVPVMVRQALQRQGLTLAEPLYLATSFTPVNGQVTKDSTTLEYLIWTGLIGGTILALKAFGAAYEVHREIQRGDRGA
jgi:hypothetical protein